MSEMKDVWGPPDTVALPLTPTDRLPFTLPLSPAQLPSRGPRRGLEQSRFADCEYLCVRPFGLESLFSERSVPVSTLSLGLDTEARDARSRILLPPPGTP